MTHTKKNWMRAFALILAVLTVFGIVPIMSASASTIGDGSTTCEVVPINQRQFLLTTTAGKRLGAFAYRYTTNDGLSGSAYCIDHVLNMTQHTLEIRGEYNASPATAGAFANGYPQHSIETFLNRFPGETMLNGLTEQEYMYATQIAVWATLGQLGIEGSSFTAGSEYVAQPTGDAQQMRVFRAVQLILHSAEQWDRIYHTGMYIRLEEDELGGNISIPGDMTLEYAADNQRFGIKREVIGGRSYYTREYIFASATSTYYDDYNIEVWADGAPSGYMFVDENNQELAHGSFRDISTWRVPTVIHTSDINDNGFEYWGRAKLCIPVDTVPNSGEITINCGSYVMQYQIYLAHNSVATEQSYIIADPSKGTLTADAVITWGSEETETGDLQITKIGGGGQPLEGAKFTLSGSDGSSISGTTNASGNILWTNLKPDVQYTLTETEAPAGYAITDAVNVTIQAARTNYVTVKDSTQKTLTVRKIDAQNGYSLQGATIAFKQIDGSYYTTGVTDHAGIIQFDADQLPLGSYEVYEISAPEGYELDTEKQTVDWNGKYDVTITFRNVRKPKLVIYKCDEGNLRCLPGATFEIFRDGQLVTTVTTNDNGVATVPDVTEGYYTVIETVAPAGYVLDPTEHGIYVNPYDPGTSADPQITITNGSKPHLKIRKLDAETQEPLSDTTFEVYRDATLIGTYTTDYNGEIMLTDLTPGTYVVKETAVKDGYVLNDTPQQIEIKAGKEDYSLVFSNSRKPGLKIVKYDEQTMSLLSDTTFEVYRDTELIGTYTTDANGEIFLYDLQPGTYLVKEIAVKPGYVVNSTPQEIEIEAGNENYTLVFLNLVKPGIHLVKIDAETKEPLPNARFRVSLVGGTYSKEFTTDASGEIELTDLEPGSYICEELTAPEHYLIDDAQRTIRINAGESARFVFTDSRKPSLTVIKYDANLDKRLSGATFRVAKIEDGSHYLDRITDTSGSFTINDLEPGVYSVMEMDAPTGYVLVKTEYHVELFPGKDSQLIVNNEKKPDLKIIKKDAVTGEPIAGATFTIRKMDSATLTTETTDANGEIFLREMEPGVYEITEQSVPDEYLLDPDPQKITLIPNELGIVQFQDYKKPTLTVKKIDAATGKPVEGARFHVIYASNHTFTGEVNDLGDYISDADGIIHLDKLRDGWYQITETQAPEGYRIQDTGVYECYIAAGTDKEIIIENVPLSTILIQKMDEETGKPLPGAWFRLKYLNEMTTMDGSTLGEYVTDENGQIEITDLDEGTYIVEEISAPAGYVMSEANTRTVYLAGESQDFITITYGNQKMGSLLIVKKDAITGAPLSGVEFFVTDSDGAVVGNSNGYFTTDYAGSILIPNLEPGKTIVAKETRTVSGYVLDDTPQTIKIKANETMTLEFRDQPKGTLIVQKIDAATGEPLTGAEFRITAANGELTPDNEGLTSSNGIYRVDSNGQIVLEKLEPGAYVVTEIKAPEGYVLIAQPQTVVVNPGDTQTLFFGNPPKGSLVINKLDSLTGEPLEGCVFKITYADGRVVDDGKLSSNGLYNTDKNGQIVISGITGTLVVTEEQTIPGYMIDPETRSQTVVINPDDVQTLTFFNAPKGTLIVEKFDKATGKPLEGAEFRIVTSNGELLADNEGLTSTNGIYVTDENGQIVLSKLSPATYIVTEIAAPEGYELDPMPQTVVVNTADTQTVRFYDEPLATLTIIKRDIDTGELLAGAAFTVKDAAGNLIGDEKQYVTGNDGTVTLTGLTPNTAVVVSEDEPPQGYWNGSDLQTAYLRSGELNSVTFENRKLGTLIIRKFIEGTNNQPLKGVAFRVTSSDGTDLGPDGGVYYTNAAGEIVLNDLQPDITVKVREIKTVDGYILDGTPQDIRIIGGQTQQLTFWNAPEQVLTIQKYEEGTTDPIEGVIFLVTDSSGMVLGTNNGAFSTDRAGRIVITGLTPGVTVTAKELKAAPGYVLDSTPQSIKIRAGEAQTMTFYNSPKGSLIIRKVDSVTGEALANAEFIITRIDGSYVDDHKGQTSTQGIYYTDRYGEIRLTDLDPDTYVIRETRAPQGYVLAGEERSVQLNASDTQTVVFENVPLQTVVIQKYIQGTTKPLAGVVFLVTDGSGNPIGSADGKHMTDENGRIVLTGLAPGTTLLVREIRTVDGYALNGTPQVIVVGVDGGSSTAAASVPVLKSLYTANSAKALDAGSVTTGTGNSLVFFDEPLSTLIVHKYVTGTKNEPLSGVAFKFTDGNGGAIGPSDGVYYTDAQGEIIITDLEQGTVVTVREVATIGGYILDGTPKQVEIKSSDVHELVFWNARQQSLTVQKYVMGTTDPIEGAVFLITDSSGAVLGTNNGEFTTDRNGRITIDGLEPGTTVTAKEIRAAKGYVLDSTPQSIKIVSGEAQSMTFYNERMGALIVRKVDRISGEALEGAEFLITTIDGQFVDDHSGQTSSKGIYRTDSNGEIRLTDLTPDSYVIRETRAPEGYVLDTEEQSVRVNPNDTQTVVFTNTPKQNLVIQKYEKGTTKPISDVTFLLTDGSGNPVGPGNGEYLTDENGRIVLTGLEPGMTVIAKEIRATEGFVLNGRPQSITIKAGEEQSLTFYNERKGSLIVRKMDSVTGEALEGAEFLICRIDGSYVDDADGQVSTKGIYYTDEHGEIRLTGLEPDSYVIRETKAPEDYVLDSQEQTVQVNANDTQYLTFENTPLQSLVIQKYAEGTTDPLAGVTFLITDSTGNYVGSADGRHVTDADGRIVLSGLVPGTTLVIREVKTVKGYNLNSEPRTVVVGVNGATRAEASTVNNKTAVGSNEIVIYDEPLSTLVIHKYISGTQNEPLTGVAFEVRDGNGGAIGPGDGVWYTDSQGEIVIPNLEQGMVLTVREVRTVDGYVLDGTSKQVEIKSSEVHELTFWNAPMQTLTIRKVDDESGEPIEGVIFKITDSSGAVVGSSNGEYTTDRSGSIVLSGLNPGVTVTAVEIKAAPGYVLDSTPQSIQIQSGDAQTLTFYNKKLGGLVIRKVDSITGETLAGAEFLICRSDGSFVDDNTSQTSSKGLYYTDSNGEIRLSSLAPDTYVIRETSAPNGYVLDSAEQTVKVNANDTQYLTFTNTPKQTVIIRKYVDGTTTPLAGVVFHITDSAGNPVGSADGKHVTDENGMITLTGLTPGTTLLVRETRTVKGYALSGAVQTIVVGTNTPALRSAAGSTGAAGSGNELIVYDEPLSTLVIKKYVEGTDREPLSGVAFLVTDGNGGAVGNNDGVWYTNSEGEIVIPDLEKGMVVTVREVKTVDGYVLDGTPKQVEIKNSEVHELVFWNARRGALTIHALDSATMQPIEGVTFKITTATGEFVPDKDGKISSNGLYKTDEAGEIVLTGVTGTFVVSMVETVPGYSIHEATRSQTIVVNPDDTQELTAYCNPLQSLLIRVFEQGTTNPLEGIVFKVTSSDGTVVGDANGEYVTDRNGQFSITGLMPGITITAQEVGCISGYILNSVPQSILIKSGEMQTLTFFNERKGNLIIKLKDSASGQPIANAEFRITTIAGVYVDDNEGLTSTKGLYRTDENGEIRLLLLKPDTYEITQLTTDANHVMDSQPQTVKVNGNDTQTVEFVNSALQSLVITKVDGNTGKPLAGVTFLITYGNGMPVGGSGEFTTDANGRIVITGLPAGTTVVAKEVKTIKGYALDPTPQIITITGAYGQAYSAAAGVPSSDGSGGTTAGTVSGGNQLTFSDGQLNTLVIHKYEEGTENTPLAGVEFKITDGSGAPVGNANGIYVTDKSGEIRIPNLEAGAVITVRETKALDGYVLDGMPQTIEIRGSGEANELTFRNSRQGALVIKKLDSVTKQPLSGVEFKITYADGSYVAAEGGKLNSNGHFLTDRNGEIRISGVIGTVVVTEEKTIPGYTINEGERTQTATVSESSTTTLTFYNSPAGGLLITKSDEDTGERIKGVQFEVRKMNGEVIGTYTTDRHGLIELPSLEAGWYQVTELKAADGYKLDVTPAQVCVKDGQTTQLMLTNKRMASIMIHKIDANTKKGIYGVKFVLYDEGKNPLGEYATDQDGYIWIKDEFPEGKYFIRELQAAEGYVLDDQYKTVYIERGKTAQITWENVAVTGQIQVRKYASDYNEITGQQKGDALKGAVFEITNARSGAVVGYIMSDAHGVAASAPLPLGRYYVTEVTAPAYYQLSGERMIAEIEYAGQIIKLSCYNKPVKLGVTISKVGNKEVMPANTMRYDFSNIANTSNVALDNFFWHDRIPTDATNAVSLTTGTYNQRLYYRIMFKTNVNDYRLLAKDLLTTNNYSVSLKPEALGLGTGEYVTDIRFEFGTVPSGFASVTKPTLQVMVKGDVTDGYNIVNRADVGGQYLNEWQTATASWLTVVFRPADTSPLPKTGY